MMKKRLSILLGLLLLTSCDALESDSGSSQNSEDFVDVYIGAQRLQCDESSGYSLAETEAFLTDVGIGVTESFCGELTGLSYAAVCGGGTPYINIHRIDSADLANAENTGFADVSALDADSLSYEVLDSCDF